jgi:hypothetical protein
MTDTPSMQEDVRAAGATSSARQVAIAAFAWALLFGVVSMYWAAGGTIGQNTLSRSIQDLGERREPAFVVTVWITGIAKVLGGLIPLALAFGWWRRIPRTLLRILCVVIGVLLVLYGLGDVTRAVLVITGIIDVADPADRNVARWYLWLWGPVWIIGGVCFVATAWLHQRSRSRNDRSTRRRNNAVSRERRR